MGQQPNVEIEPEDRPRPVLEPAPARRWKARRPGDLGGPDEVPWGGAFGTPGPNSGYALKLLGGADLDIEESEDRDAVKKALAHIMVARSSHFGKAPAKEDLEVALLIFGLGLLEGELDEEQVAGIARSRKRWAPRVARSEAKAREMVSLIPAEALRDTPDGIRRRLALGEVLLDS